MTDMNHTDAIKILAHLFESPTVGATEERVEALHAIVADVIDSCALAAQACMYNMLDDLPEDLRVKAADGTQEDVTMAANDYVANHYGVEEFGL